jgi:hypothetical protein
LARRGRRWLRVEERREEAMAHSVICTGACWKRLERGFADQTTSTRPATLVALRSQRTAARTRSERVSHRVLSSGQRPRVRCQLCAIASQPATISPNRSHAPPAGSASSEGSPTKRRRLDPQPWSPSAPLTRSERVSHRVLSSGQRPRVRCQLCAIASQPANIIEVRERHAACEVWRSGQCNVEHSLHTHARCGRIPPTL